MENVIPKGISSIIEKFYLYFPDEEIVNACVHNLTWTHFRSLLRVSDENVRLWYTKEASDEGWSSRTLDRNIATQYYYRLMQSPKKDDVVNEMLQKNKDNQKTQYELLKSPIVAEFLVFKAENSFLESDLESTILTHVRDFLMEIPYYNNERKKDGLGHMAPAGYRKANPKGTYPMIFKDNL